MCIFTIWSIQAYKSKVRLMRKLGGAKGEDGNEAQSDPSPIFFLEFIWGCWGSTAGASDASPVCPDLEARRLKWPLLLLGLSLPDSPFEIYKREIQIQFNAPLSTWLPNPPKKASLLVILNCCEECVHDLYFICTRLQQTDHENCSWNPLL